MGYYTRFAGQIYDNDNKVVEEAVAKEIAKLDEFRNYMDGTIPTTINSVIACEEHKWYTFFDDMDEVSKKFPSITIEIYGEGDEPGDIWRAYFHNGVHIIQYAEIVYPDFDPNIFGG